MKKILAAILFLNILVLSLSGCIKVEISQNTPVESNISAEVNEQQAVDATTKSIEATKAENSSDVAKEDDTKAASNNETGKVYRIGIGQFAEHPSLDNCRLGIIEGLKEQGFVEGKNLEIKYDNAQTDGSFASQIYNNYKNNNFDLVFAIATPMAQSAYSVFCSNRSCSCKYCK